MSYAATITVPGYLYGQVREMLEREMDRLVADARNGVDAKSMKAKCI